MDLQIDRVNEIPNEYVNDISENERILINYIEKNKKINRIEAEKILDLKKTHTIEVLNSLIAKGIIRRAGKGRNTVYIFETKAK